MISRDYQPDDYRLPLSPEHEQHLLDQAQLEYEMRNPVYSRHEHGTPERYDDNHEAYRQSMEFERLAPTYNL